MTRPDGYLVPGKIAAHGVVDEVARGFLLTRDDLMGPCQSSHVAVARACAMAVLREWTTLSYPEIAKMFNRDHSSVIRTVRKVMGDPDLARNVRLVVDELSPPPTLFSSTGFPHAVTTIVPQADGGIL